ncbi:unnamed protein product [Camellia sinensis]
MSSICFKAARIAAILIDDGIEFDKMHDIEWHRNFAPVVGKILRIEHLAEKILDEVRFFQSFPLGRHSYTCYIYRVFNYYECIFSIANAFLLVKLTIRKTKILCCGWH